MYLFYVSVHPGLCEISQAEKVREWEKKKFKRLWIKSRVLTLSCWRLEVQGQGVTLTPFLLRPLSLPKDCDVFNLCHHVVLPVCLCPNILFFYSINIDTKVPI